jgi:hypothetical protein
MSDRLQAVLEGFRIIEGLEISTMEREVGLYYKKHKALSEGAKRFVAICHDRFAST